MGQLLTSTPVGLILQSTDSRRQWRCFKALEHLPERLEKRPVHFCLYRFEKNGRVKFELFSPYSPQVELVGSWSAKPVPMTQDSQGVWRAELEPPPGQHRYRYRTRSLSPFLKGRTVEVADPLARRVDKATDSGLLVIEKGRDLTTTYEWQHDHLPLPQNHELVLYELHVREFASKGRKPGTFLGLLERLDYLQDLGVNALQLMPISAFPSEKSWGYNPRHACAPDPSYGTPQELKRLVDEAHRRGMRVLLDAVFNHSDTEAPLTRLDFFYWYRNARRGELSFGPKLDYERFDSNLGVFPARRFALEVARHWMQEYHIDGFRLDATRVLDNFDFLWELRRLAEQTVRGKPFYLVAEHIPEDPAVAGAFGPAHGAWHHGFYGEVLAHFTRRAYDPQRLAARLQPRNHGYVRPDWVVNYLQTHDEKPLMRQLGEAKVFGEAALRRNKLAATLLFTAVGNPMLAQGQEWGDYRPKSLRVRNLNWKLEAQPYGQALKAHYRHLARLRHGSPALKGSDFTVKFVDEGRGILTYQRGYGQAEVQVAVNLKEQYQNFRMPFPDGKWHELLYGYDKTVRGGWLEEGLEGFGAKVFARAS